MTAAESVRTTLPVIGIAGTTHTLYALRGDGAVFVLVKRGDMTPLGGIAENPYWAAIPAVPGTLAAVEQEG